jgi:3-oxoacyl-[acyl-carrier protein] reductase
VRVVTLRTGGVPETLPEGLDTREAIEESIRSQTMLDRVATLQTSATSGPSSLPIELGP